MIHLIRIRQCTADEYEPGVSEAVTVYVKELTLEQGEPDDLRIGFAGSAIDGVAGYIVESRRAAFP